ncbi:hypothetical protein ACWGA9_06120 [Streptomyces sp. NPDC054950]
MIVFPDAVLVMTEYLRSVLPGLRIESKVPTTRPAEFVRLKRLGGVSRIRILDRPRMDVECWSDTEGNAADLMLRVRPFVLAMAGKRGDTTVYRVTEVSGPMWLPDSESGQPKYAFAVEFSTRGTEME